MAFTNLESIIQEDTNPISELHSMLSKQNNVIAELMELVNSYESRLSSLEQISPNRISLSCAGKDPIFVVPSWCKSE